MATIKDVAKLAGVSVSTVSIVVNNKAGERSISNETCEHVRWAINELGYQPNVSARKLRAPNQTKPLIAFYWPLDLRSNSLGWILRGLQSAFDSMFFTCDIVVCNYQIDHLKDTKIVDDNARYNAIIIGGTSSSDLEYLKTLNFNIPVVLYSRYSETISCAYSDNSKAGKKAAELIITHGYRNPAIVKADADYSTSSQRIKSFRETLEKEGILIPESRVFSTLDAIPSGYEEGLKLLPIIKDIDVIFCQTDSIALGVSHALTSNGVRIPENVALFTSVFLNPDYTRYSNPSISSVSVPTESLTEATVQILINLLNHKLTSPVHKELEVTITERTSTEPR